jgi:CheY-like chemotaxis protein
VSQRNGSKRIFHVSSRQTVMALRDQILRMHGFEVDSTVYTRDTVYPPEAVDQVAWKDYDLVLIDVEADVKVQSAQQLCDEIKKENPGQHVAFVCNYRVNIESDCPDEIIRAEFDPKAFVKGVEQALGTPNPVDKN